MYPNICHIYGPLYLNCYGLSIGLSIIVFTCLIQKNKKLQEIVSFEKFNNIMMYNIIVAMIGGRILSLIQNWQYIDNYYEIFALWEPGYSFLGSLIAILLFAPVYLKKINVPILPLLDVTSIYAPLLHAISRIGCFLAGCCHGLPTSMPWGIIYTHPESAVPDSLKFVKIHPTQIYASIALFLIFIAMYFVFQKRLTITGQLMSVYLILGSTERFFNDFFRSSRNFFDEKLFSFLSIDQWLSISICLLGIILFLQFTYNLYATEKYIAKKYESI